MENDRLLVLYPQKRGSEKERARLDEVLEAALDGIDAEIVENMDLLEQDPERYRGRRLLFAVPLGKRRRGSWRSRRTVPAARLSDGRWWKELPLSTTI